MMREGRLDLWGGGGRAGAGPSRDSGDTTLLPPHFS